MDSYDRSNMEYIKEVRLRVIADFADGHYGRYGNLGRLAHCFAQIGIPFDIGISGNSKHDRDGGASRVNKYHITIPPDVEFNPDQTPLFCFNADYSFDIAIAENAYPMGYRVVKE